MQLRTVKTVVWSAIGGALVWWIVLGAGFGWMSAGSAEKKAEAQTEAAVLDVLTPICVETFHQDTKSETKLKVLKEMSTWNRADYVVKQGWATTLENDALETRLAKACATQILAADRS